MCGPPARSQSAPVGLVQHAGQDAGPTTLSSLAFSTTNGAGHFIAVAIRAGRLNQVLAVADSNGNTYSQAAQLNVTVDTPLGDTLAIYYAENIKAGPNTVTVSSLPSGATLRFAILEFSGVASSNSADGAVAGQGTNSSAVSGNISTTANGDLLLGAVMSADGQVFVAGSGYAIQDQVPGAPGTKLITEHRIQTAAGTASAGASLSTANAWGATLAAFRAAADAPAVTADLTLTTTHTGVFTQSQSGVYTLIASNGGSASTTGTVTVTDTLPGELGPAALGGSGWNCDLGSLTCTRSDPLPAGTSYPAISLTVDVVSGGAVTITNTATVSGGGEINTSNNSASDVTSILPPSSDTQPPTAPGNLTATVSGGNQISLNWSVSTDNNGVLDYRVEQCTGMACTDFTEVGTVGAASSVGPLSASANPNYFKDASGTPLILNGSHTWNSLQDWGSNGSLQTLDFTAFVNFLVAHGHNFTLLWRAELPRFCGMPTTASSPPDFMVGPHPWLRTGPGTATDGGLRFDLTRFEQSYFDRLRTRVQALSNAGIYAGVYLFTGEWLNAFRCPSDGFPFTGANNVNGIDDGGGIGSMTMTSPNAITAFQDAYVRKVIDTLNDLPNVLWIVSEEAPTNSTWWSAHQIAQIRSYESGKPFHHPIGYGTLANLLDSAINNSDADWISPAARTSPTTSCGGGSPPCKVSINDSDHSYYGMWQDTDQQNRNYAWQNFTNGNQVAFMDPYVLNYPRESRNLCPSPTNGICTDPAPRWDNFRDNLGYILRYSRRLNLSSVTPRGSLSSTGHCLAQTPTAGAEYLVYAPNGGSFTVNLSAMSSSRTLTMEWFDPSSGATTVAGSIPAGSSAQAFTPPFSGDAVLYLADTSGHATSVATATSYSVMGLASGTFRYRVRAADAAGNLGPYSNTASATIAATSAPDLSITMTHAGSFTQRQSGATYTLIVTNAGTGATEAAVTATNTLPAGLTATAIGGTGWTCTLGTVTCTRSNSLAANSTYPAIILTVNVAANAPASVTNSATVSGGGDTTPGNNTATDPTTISAYAVGPYPVSVHSSGRYLVDSTGLPFPLIGDSPQGMIANLSLADAQVYFASRQSYGYNAVQIHLLAGPKFNGRSDFSTYDGITPFTTAGDIATPREAYFARVDNILNLAAQANMLVFLTAAETIDGLTLFKSNGATKCRAFGQYLGNRYKNYNNIVWDYGNDFQTWRTSDINVILAVVDGIKDKAPNQPNTAWLDYSVSASRDSTSFDSRVQLDLVYTYYATYAKTLDEYAKSTAKPIHLGETNYEEESLRGYLTTPMILRKQNYWAMTSGASGVFSVNSYMWNFKAGWKSHLDTTGTKELAHFINLFRSISWQTLVPDSTHQVMTAGYGTYASLGEINTNDYATAAMTSDNMTMVAYLPTSRAVTVNMGKFTGGNVTARWYNPTSGAWTAVGTYSPSGSHSFTPSSGDWVLVLMTQPASAGRVPADATGPGQPLYIQKTGGGQITLSWSSSCLGTDNDYEIYEGTIGSYYSHTARFCTTAGASAMTITPTSASMYYLVVPRNGAREGSYGTRRGNGGSVSERPQGTSACFPQQIATCP